MSPQGAAIVPVKGGAFASDVLARDGRSLVYFWASWCGPCKLLTHLLEQWARADGGTPVFRVDVDEDPDLMGSYNVANVPTVILFENGLPLRALAGALTRRQLRTLVAGNAGG